MINVTKPMAYQLSNKDEKKSRLFSLRGTFLVETGIVNLIAFFNDLTE